jgi:hypothetical protein
LFSFSDCGCSRVLTFDDIAITNNIKYGSIPNGYGGLNWTNALYMNTTWEKVTYGWNGYATGLTSGIFDGFNSNGQQMAISTPVGQYFTMNSISLSAAWRNNLVLTMKATRSNVSVYETVIILQVASKTVLSSLKWSMIDKVTLIGGTPYPNLNGNAEQFVFDDIDITM